MPSTERGPSPSPLGYCQHCPHCQALPITPNKHQKIDQTPSTPGGSVLERHDAVQEPVTPTQPHNSAFLNLPGELRNKIYRYTLYYDTPLELHHVTIRYVAKVNLVKPYKLATGLLRANRQIHEEATPILYGNNTFQGDHIVLLTFTRSIQRMQAHVRALSVTDLALIIWLDPEESHANLSWLEEYPAIERLELHFDLLSRSRFRALPDSRDVARAVFWHAHEWIAAIQSASEHKHPALERFRLFFPDEFNFDQELFRQEFSYFATNYMPDERMRLERTDEFLGRKMECFLDLVERRVQALENGGFSKHAEDDALD